MLTLHKPERTIEQLKALAASGSSRFARKAQAELQQRIQASLRASLDSERTKTGEGSR
jgi:hypothetical protein